MVKNAKKKKLSNFELINQLLKKGLANLTDLIELGYLFEGFINHEFYTASDAESEDEVDPAGLFTTNIDLNSLLRITKELDNLNKMTGMTDIKETLFQQLLYFLQDLNDKNDFLHSVIYGSPGTGKTTVARIMANIYKSLGFLSKGTVKYATKDVLVGQYIGETAIKTKKFLDSCIGGVMLFDEAYQISSGNLDKADSYSKECIDVLNQFLLEHRQNFICILAGYKDDIEQTFFSMNKGLERRFPWRFEIKDYKANELERIFYSQVFTTSWAVDKDCIPVDFFEKNKKLFIYNGGDTEILFNKIKIAHSQRIMNCEKTKKKLINREDFLKGFDLFKETENVKKRLENKDDKIPFMYI